MQVLPVGHIFPAALLEYRDLLLRQYRLLQEGGCVDLHPVPGPAGLHPLGFAEIPAPLFEPPAFGLHVAVEFFVLTQLIGAGVECVSPIHSSASSSSFPSATSCFSRRYSASRAARPASVMA